MSIEFIAAVLEMPHDRQNRHWSGWAPWKFQGKNVRLPGGAPMTSRNVTVDSSGNVTRVSRLVQRPCFGSPIAFLVHGGERWNLTKTGETRPSRCNTKSCPAAEACAYVAQRRLRATASIRDAHEHFEDAGGRLELTRQKKEGRPGRASHAWGMLLRTLSEHGPFDCKNMDMLRGYVATHLVEARRKDAERQAAARLVKRRAKMLAGAEDESFLQQLRLEASLRALSFEQARGQPNAPAWIARCKSDGGVFTAEVW
jgi:hypothetical protein